jgi:hypothetical protein
MIRFAVLINYGEYSVVLFWQVVLTHIAPGFKILKRKNLLDERTSDVQLYLPNEHEKAGPPKKASPPINRIYSAAFAAFAAPS